MKKFSILLCALFLNVSLAFAAGNAETGIRILNDHNKTFIIDVLDNTPASEAGIMPGSQLYKINDKNIKNYTPNEIITLLFGEENSNITLTIKSYGKKKKITFKRKKLEYPKADNREYMNYWMQIAPNYFVNAKILNTNEEYGRNIKRYIYANNYWANRRISFEKSYNYYKQQQKTKDLEKYIQSQQSKSGNPKGQEWFIKMNNQLLYFDELIKK